MVLGGNIVQTEAIREAVRLGCHTICADIHRDAPGHVDASESCYIDITDREEVLRQARKFAIDGIMPYCSDTLAPIAAYVAEQMGLPGNPYDSVMTLVRKDRFRAFLKSNGFPVPESGAFDSEADAIAFYDTIASSGNDAIMKPADSSGSRGVFRISSKEDIKRHWAESMSFSQCRKVILEQFIEKKGLEVDGDFFVSEGKIIFAGFLDQHHLAGSAAYFIPVTLSSPCTKPDVVKRQVVSELQRLFHLLKIQTGPFNVEWIEGKDGKIYFLDIGPRNGGCQIPLLEEKAYGFPELEYTVRSAVGSSSLRWSRSEPPSAVMYYRPSSYTAGRYIGLRISDAFKQHIFNIVHLCKPGANVRKPVNGSDSTDVVFASFGDTATMDQYIENIWNHVSVEVEDMIDKEIGCETEDEGA